MTLEDLGNLGEFLAALGVLVTLIYLAIQIRQNTHATRASTALEATRDQSAAMYQLNSDAELNRIFYQGCRDFESLSREEQRRFATYMTSTLRSLENILYQTEHGTLDREAWVGIREQIKYVFSQPGTIVWWKRAQNLFNPQLRQFVEREFL